MCVYSMVSDHFIDKWRDRINESPFAPYQPAPATFPINLEPRITDEEIREFRKLLERAREYDRKNNEPECELEEKKETLKELAKQLGVEITFPE